MNVCQVQVIIILMRDYKSLKERSKMKQNEKSKYSKSDYVWKFSV